MPRGNVSKYEYLRPEITEKFLAGQCSADIVAEYSQIPRRTVYRWLKEVKDLTGTVLAQPRSDEPIDYQECQSEHRANLTVLPMSNTTEDSLPDFLYLKRKLRRIINTDGDDLSKNDGIRVNAINAYLKLVLAEIGNKQALIEEEDDLEEEQNDYTDKSYEELIEIYNRKIKEA